MALTPGTRIGSYEIAEQIGVGGMGEVYRGTDTRLGRTVAIKVLSGDFTADPSLRQRFEREARAIAALNHPHVCTLHDIGSDNGADFLVMEYLSGQTLAARLQQGALPSEQALQIASEIADALDQAHRQGIIHRDLKLANVMLGENGHVKVMDFGLAKDVSAGSPDDAETVGQLTGVGVRLGTPGYMAPEQLLGAHTDERTDIFAFGILLYELLAGAHPFARSSRSDMMSAILREAAPPVQQYARRLPERARTTLDRLLAKEPGDRYQSFADVRADLAQLSQDCSGVTPLATPIPAAEGGAQRTPYVGREAERAEVRRLLDGAAAGAGAVVLVGGEPGVGKTRLAEELLAEARQRGCLSLVGRCYEMEGTPPFIPFVEMVERSVRIVPRASMREALGDAASEIARIVPELRRLFPDIPPPIELPPEQQRRYLFNSFLEFVERGCRVSPQVVLLDDLHWADDSTLQLLQHLAQHVSGLPLLIVGTYRDVDLEVDRPFAKTLEALTRRRLAHKVTIRRLVESGVRDMLEALSGQAPPTDLVEAVFHETEGNPFFVEEVFQHLSEEGRLFTPDGQWRPDLRVDQLDVPEGIRLVIGRRLERLGDEHRALLTTAAIIGRSFDLSLLEALSDADEDAVLTALEAAEAVKLILPVSSGRDPRWEFAHGLIRQTIEHGLSLRRRQRVHLRVADGLERMHGDRAELHAADIAHHLYEAGAAADADRTLRFLTLAGDQALAAGAFDEAVRRFAEALSIHDENGEETDAASRLVADLRDRKGQALRSLNRTDEAVGEWLQALETYERLGDDAAIARTAQAATSAELWRGEIQVGRGIVKRGLDAIRGERTADRSRLMAILAWAQTVSGDPSGLRRAEEAATLAEEIGDPRLLADVWLAKSWSHHHVMQQRPGETLALQAAEGFRATANSYLLVDALSSVMCAWLFAGRLDPLSRLGAETEALARRVGHAGAEWCCGWAMALPGLLRLGDFDSAEQYIRTDIERLRDAGFGWRFIDYNWLGQLHFYRGRWSEAEREYKNAIELETADSYWSGTSRIVLLLAHAYAGMPDAVTAVRRAREGLGELGGENALGRWSQVAMLVEAAAVLDSREDAAALYPTARRAPQQDAVLTNLYRLWQMVAGIAAACGERWGESQEHFEIALRQATELPHKIAQPEVRRWYARMLLDRGATGDRERARALLGEAIEMYRTLGMPKHLEMVKDLQARAQARGGTSAPA